MTRTVNNLRVDQLLLTSRQAAHALQISERKLWSMKASGEIPHVLLKRSVRYLSGRAFVHSDDFLAFLEKINDEVITVGSQR